MSTFKIEDAKWIDWIFPETRWEELDLPKYQEIFDILKSVETLNSEVLEYIQKKKIRIGFHKQYNAGGGWTFLKNITLTPGDNPTDPYVLSLIIHETFHLKQSIWARLSVQGELRAWQYQKQTYPQIAKTKGNEIGAAHEAYGGTKVHWDKIATLSSESREDLKTAIGVMKSVAPGYRSDRLPLYPLPQEIGYFLKQGKIMDAIKVITNLMFGSS